MITYTAEEPEKRVPFASDSKKIQIKKFIFLTNELDMCKNIKRWSVFLNTETVLGIELSMFYYYG